MDCTTENDGQTTPTSEAVGLALYEVMRLTEEEQMVRRLLGRLERWLQRERRLVEAASGEPLARAFFVSIDDANRVTGVLAVAPQTE